MIYLFQRSAYREPLLHIATYRPSFGGVRYAASFFIYFVVMRFLRAGLVRGVVRPYFQVGLLGSRRGVKSGGWLSGLALLESYSVSSPW